MLTQSFSKEHTHLFSQSKNRCHIYLWNV